MRDFAGQALATRPSLFGIKAFQQSLSMLDAGRKSGFTFYFRKVNL
jgi:hypothetical protein